MFTSLTAHGSVHKKGGPLAIDLEHFTEALRDPSAQLTYTSLTGARKQSISDAERLFSKSVVSFMEENGYNEEAMYTKVVMQWRMACDERGLTELQRCRYNYELLNYILEDLMPWFKENYDFSTLEVNRYAIAQPCHVISIVFSYNNFFWF